MKVHKYIWEKDNGNWLFCHYLVMVENKNFIIKMKENVYKEISYQNSEIRTVTCKYGCN